MPGYGILPLTISPRDVTDETYPVQSQLARTGQFLA